MEKISFTEILKSDQPGKGKSKADRGKDHALPKDIRGSELYDVKETEIYYISLQEEPNRLLLLFQKIKD